MSGRIIFLYGPPGSGKSTIGRRFAQDLDLTFLDLDEEIENDSGKPVWKIFADEGESSFRRRESDMLKSLIGQHPGIISLGGGTLLNNENRALVETSGDVVVLDVPLHVMRSRLENDPNQRPLLADKLEEKLENLLKSRADHYLSFHHHLDAALLNPEETSRELQIRLGMFRVKGMGTAKSLTDGQYDVRIRPGILKQAGAEISARGFKGPVVLVTDENVGPVYAGMVMDTLIQEGYPVQIFQLPAGEEHKSIANIGRMWEFFLSNQLDRGSTVVALGGGVVSDMAGFAAATYLRGIRWVCLPTTLLSMADASIGGKTGADLPQGKNLVGAFHPPSLVLVDPDVLSTLPEREMRSGLAEVIKHGVISDPVLFAACQGLAGSTIDELRMKPLADIIRRAMAVKIRVIEQDPYEQNIRAILNAGHTIGHAVELASRYRISHGEAVAIGLVIETRMAEELGVAQTGLADEIRTLLEGVGLPVAIPAGLDRDVIEEAIFRDKKRTGSGVKFALPVKIGQAKHGISLTLDELRRNHAFHSCFTRS